MKLASNFSISKPLDTEPINGFSIGICRLGGGSHHPRRLPADGPQVEKSVIFLRFFAKMIFCPGMEVTSLGTGRVSLGMVEHIC